MFPPFHELTYTDYKIVSGRFPLTETNVTCIALANDPVNNHLNHAGLLE